MSDERHEYRQEPLWRTDVETEQWVASEAAALIAAMLRGYDYDVTLTDTPKGGRQIRARVEDFDISVTVHARFRD